MRTSRRPSGFTPRARPSVAGVTGVTERNPWERLGDLGVLLPLAAAYLLFALRARAGQPLSGDEPHYLAITQGLWLYHTVDQHRVLYGHDFFAYFPHLMSSHAVHRGAHLYPLHYLGLPLLLLPGFVLAGAAGGRVTLSLVALLVAWRTLRLARRVAGPAAAALTVGALGLSAPFVLNAGAIYPDLPSALLLTLAYEAVDAPRLTPRRALALGALLACMPWLHVKLLAVAAVYLVWAVFLLWRQTWAGDAPGRGIVASGLLALGLPALSLVGLMLFSRALYGSLNPTAPYQGGPTLLSGNPVEGAMGQIFAQGQGALGTAPFILLALPGLVVLWQRDRPTALKIALVTVPFWLLTLTYRNWWGGDCPPLRFLLPVLPLWAIGIAALLARVRTILARLVVALLVAWTLALSLVIPAAPRLGWPLPDGRGALALALGARLRLPLAAWLPAVDPATVGPDVWRNAALVPVWTAGLFLLWGILAWWERRARASTP